MFIIVCLDDSFVVCNSTGDRKVFCNEELAKSHCLAISANNPGVFSVESALDSRYFYFARGCVEHNNPLKIRGVRPRNENMVIFAA